MLFNIADINVLKRILNDLRNFVKPRILYAVKFTLFHRQVDQIAGTIRREWRRWRRRRRYRRRRRAVLRRRWCRRPGRCDARQRSRETCRRRRTTWRTICTTRCSRRRTTSGGRRGSTRRAVTTAAAAATVRRVTRAHGVWPLPVFRRRSRDDGTPSSSGGEYSLYCCSEKDIYIYHLSNLIYIITILKMKNGVKNCICMGAENNGRAQRRAAEMICRRTRPLRRRRIPRESPIPHIASRWSSTRKKTTQTVPVWTSTKQRCTEKPICSKWITNKCWIFLVKSSMFKLW